MATRQLTLCVVGTGSIGLRHLRLLAQEAGVRAIAVPRRPGRASELRAQGFEAVELDEVARLQVDGAIIASDTAQHVADATRFGRDVSLLVEKPVDVDARAAAALKDAGHRSVHVACVLRFNPGLTWLRRNLSMLGRVQRVDAECLSWLPSWRPHADYRTTYSARVGEGGVLRDVIHELDYLHWLFGPATSVTGTTWTSGALELPRELEDSANAELTMAGEIRATVRLSFASRPASRWLRVWGTDGLLTWDALAKRASLRDAAGDELSSATWDDPAQMYRDQLAAWLAHLREGQPSSLAVLDDGVAALRVVDAIRRSSVVGQVVTL